jgi:hypothetical protein
MFFKRGIGKTKDSSEVSAMPHDYDIFEKLPDGSTIWRVCVSGWYDTERKMWELAERSKNEFYAIDITVNRPVAWSVKSASRPATKAVANR